MGEIAVCLVLVGVVGLWLVSCMALWLVLVFVVWLSLPPVVVCLDWMWLGRTFVLCLLWGRDRLGVGVVFRAVL